VVQSVKVERATVRTTLMPRPATARLARVDGRRDGSPAPAHDEIAGADRAQPSRSSSAPAGGIVLASTVRSFLKLSGCASRERAASDGPVDEDRNDERGRAPGSKRRRCRWLNWESCRGCTN
jgi:hypothetical protein